MDNKNQAKSMNIHYPENQSRYSIQINLNLLIWTVWSKLNHHIGKNLETLYESLFMTVL